MSIYQRSSSRINTNDGLEMHSTEQFTSEQSIFHHQQHKLLIHIPPTLSPRNHHYPNLFLPAASTRKSNTSLLETTSKTPLNVGLDNVLFVSTLQDYWTRTTIGSGAQNVDDKYAMIEYSSIPCRSSSGSSYSHTIQNGHDIRRLSFQSDAASTELIRRFSAESTTSSLSSISSFIFESHNKLYQQKQQHKASSSSSSSSGDAQTNDAENTMDSIIQEAPADCDPGHACETLHSPSEEDQELPVWADPIRVKENPTEFQYAKSYLKQREIPNDSSLPLAKPCVFHFSQIDNVKTYKKSEQYVSAVKPLFECDSVWGFAARWRALKEKHNKRPSDMLPNQNLFCFVRGVEPIWEDPVNKDGGRLIITVDNSKLLDDIFEWILCAFVGGELYEDGVAGIVVSKRYRGDRVELWLDQSSASDETVHLFKDKLCKLLAGSCHDVIKLGKYKKHFA